MIHEICIQAAHLCHPCIYRCDYYKCDDDCSMFDKLDGGYKIMHFTIDGKQKISCNALPLHVFSSVHETISPMSLSKNFPKTAPLNMHKGLNQLAKTF